MEQTSIASAVEQGCQVRQWAFQREIDSTHPALDASGELEIEADAMAMKLVGERHEKRDLVNLVRWLILREPFMILPGRSKWKPIATAPHNKRVFIYGRHPEGHDQGAMGWFDLIDRRWYYAPQGGLVDNWTPEWWMPIPFPLPNTAHAN